MTIKQLRDQRAAKAKEAHNLLDENTGEKWSAEISAQVDVIYSDIERLDDQIERIEKLAKIDGDRVDDQAATETRARNRRDLPPEQREQAVAYDNAFQSFVRVGVSGMLKDEIAALRGGSIQAAQSGQQANGSQGGYLVPTGWGAALLEAMKAFGGMRAVASEINTDGGNPIPWPTVDETNMVGELVPENTSATAQDITFGTTQIGAYKFSSKVFTVPIELLQDQGAGIDIEAFINRAAATRIGRAQNQFFTVGSGTAQPQGIVTAAVAGKVGATGQTTTIAPDDFVDLEHSIDPAYRTMPNVGFMMHDTTLRQIKKLKDAALRPLWLPGYDTKSPDVILGYRYTINQDMPVMAANAKSIIFGKLDEYLIRDVMNVTLFRFDDSAFMIKGQIGFLAWARADGRLITGGAPVKYYQNSAS